MSRRKGKKPPKPNPKDCYAPKLDAPGNKAGERFWYSIDDIRLLQGRLFQFIGVEDRIQIVINKLEKMRIAPNVKQLPKLLKRLGLYPPPADHADHQNCPCEWCSPKGDGSARRSFPVHYGNSKGMAYEHFLERRAIDDEAAQEDEGMKEIKEVLRGVSPGLVADVRKANGRAA